MSAARVIASVIARLLCGLCLLAGGVWFLRLALAAPPPNLPHMLVSMDRADDVHGPQHVECWLAMQPGAVMIAAEVIAIDCVSDPERVFADGFEAPAP